MMSSEKHIAVVVDNFDPDNLACAYAATNPRLGLNTAAVIVTGRFAHPDRSAPITEYDPDFPPKSGNLRRGVWRAF
ncbi:MAG TPA: hypothetical protein VK983_03220 [Candidatus Limnocylindrales bacterium]|nr:hypothetical protein [Candidatus Limnocylindrales bacterium]